MTTPERFRRRQRIEGAFLIFIGLTIIISTAYFRSADTAQRACLADNFGALSTTLNARGELARKDTKVNLIEADATRLESRANNDFYKEAFAATSDAGVFDAYGGYRVTLAEVNRMRAKVDRRRAHIAAEREAHPIPGFPAGTCDA